MREPFGKAGQMRIERDAIGRGADGALGAGLTDPEADKAHRIARQDGLRANGRSRQHYREQRGGKWRAGGDDAHEQPLISPDESRPEPARLFLHVFRRA